MTTPSTVENEPLLAIEDLQAYYGESHVLQGITLSVATNEVVSVIGRNGVGKTTTARAIMGLIEARRGAIRFNGRSIANMPPHLISRLGIGYVPQGRGIFPSLTVMDNLVFNQKPRQDAWNIDRVFSVFPRLAERAGNWAGTLSGGEQQMLSIARALLMNPQLLVMDEPSDGLAPMFVQEVGNVIKRVACEGTSILLVEQNLALALSSADRCCIVAKGRTVHTASAEVLRRDKETIKRYLGV